ncbi:MAG: hypothetical protein ACI4WT_01500 [Oligosphaeraceae bacterium]
MAAEETRRHDGKSSAGPDGWPLLRAFLEDLRRLNPDYPASELARMRQVASAVGGAPFAEAGELVSEVIGLYLDSPPKRAGGAVMAEYHALLESEERRLLTAGELSEEASVMESDAAGAAVSELSPMALVPSRALPALTRCEVLQRASFPEALTKAVDSYVRRNVMVDTVMELGVELLWLMDGEQAGAWMLRELERREADGLDPDMLRDFLRVALRQERLPEALLWRVLSWCGDTRLLETWPTVVHTGDRVLCRHAVTRWLSRHASRNASLSHLRLLFRQGRLGSSELLRWLESALSTLADCVMRIMELGNRVGSGDDYGAALFSELQRLSGLYPPVMMVGNELLCLPDGAHRFALAVFGLAGDELRRWNESLDRFSSEVIRRVFILGLRTGQAPEAIIRRLTFGDADAYRMAMSQLDLVSGRFDSMRQRERVVALLTPFYSSYRRGKFLAAEITRRYRSMMRLLHEDFLREALSAEHLSATLAAGMTVELSSVLGEARRFLGRRRDTFSSLESILAATMEFEESMRRRRLAVIRRELSGQVGKG